MNETVERMSLDLRYQPYRLRNEALEARLLASIAERGIEQPLEGVNTPDGRWLLDGFKRFRCATKLGIECLPYVCLAEEAGQGIARLMRVTEHRPLSILEQARFVVELLSEYDMSPADVAQALSRSKAWVSMRRSLLKDMSPVVQEILFRGAFPVYSYMATLRPFMRMNGVGQKEIEQFIQAVSGQRLSVREIQLLADGYFRGPASLRQAIDQGRWKWSLHQMQSVPEDPEGCNDVERKLLKELERLLKSMQRVMTDCDDSRLQTHAFHAQANLLVASLLSRRESFFKKMESLLRRTGEMS
jgi:ParB/RepB/Spo0J family partition protein